MHVDFNTPVTLEIGDVNGDGKADIVETDTTFSIDTLRVFFGAGDGSFQEAATVYASPPYHPNMSRTTTITDLNGDGVNDICVLMYSQLMTFLGNRIGTFTLASATPVDLSADGLTAADFNRDGIPDLAVTIIAADSVPVYLGRGDGTLNLPASYPSPLPCYFVFSGDFDGDGTPDLVLGASS